MRAASTGRIHKNLVAAVLFLATAAFTLWQNTRVAVLWDISYLLDSSYRISLGQLPYRDYPFAHAPLTFLVHAAIIRLFGRTYFPHIVCAALEAGTATILAWRILLKTLYRPANALDDRTRLLATLLASPLVFLGIYGVYPHPIYDSDCIFAVLLALHLLQHSAASIRRNFVAGVVCVVPLFLKQNIGVPFLLITLVAVALMAIVRRMQHASTTPQLGLLSGVAVALAVAVLAIHATFGLQNYFYWTVTFAAQRRLPGLSLILTIYHQTSLLWTIPAALTGIALLRSGGLSRTFWTRAIALVLVGAPFLWTIASLALTTESDDRSDQLLSLWPHLLILATVFALNGLRLRNLRSRPTIDTLFPFILLATIHGAFLSQQLWGSTYAIWPLLLILIAAMLTQVPTIAHPLAAMITATLLLCGGLYATSHERLSYVQFDGAESHATLPPLRGLTTPGPWIPAFEEMVQFTNARIPTSDGILLLPGDGPFYFATGRTPLFPVLLFDPATDPYTPRQTLDRVRVHNIRWLIVTRTLQLNAPPKSDLPEVLRSLQQDFTPYRTLTNYDIYRRR